MGQVPSVHWSLLMGLSTLRAQQIQRQVGTLYCEPIIALEFFGNDSSGKVKGTIGRSELLLSVGTELFHSS